MSGGKTTMDLVIRIQVHRPRCNKKADTVRVYFPPDANTLLYITDHSAQLETGSMSRRGQAAGAAVARHRHGDQNIAAKGIGILGVGQQ